MCSNIFWATHGNTKNGDVFFWTTLWSFEKKQQMNPCKAKLLRQVSGDEIYHEDSEKSQEGGGYPPGN